MTNDKNCLVARKCKLAGTEQCHSHCPVFIGLHGINGHSGRSGFSRIPQANKLMTVSTSPARDDQEKNYKVIDKYIESFTRFFIENPTPSEQIKNLYLWSESSGTGKTLTATCILNSFLAFYYLECLKQNKQPSQRPIFFLSMNSLQKDFLQMTRSGVPQELQQEAGERYYEALEIAKRSELVAFDDVGTRSVTEAFRNDILDVIDYRQSKQKPSIFTSNLPITELPTLFGEQRLFDRIRDLAIVLEFDGSSKRGRRT